VGILEVATTVAPADVDIPVQLAVPDAHNSRFSLPAVSFFLWHIKIHGEAVASLLWLSFLPN
jgi:hypothetical protein